MKKTGIGFASAWQGANYHFGYPDETNVHLEITEDGRFRISTSVADMGQGISETLSAIVSSELGDFPLGALRSDHLPRIDEGTDVQYLNFPSVGVYFHFRPIRSVPKIIHTKTLPPIIEVFRLWANKLDRYG